MKNIPLLLGTILVTILLIVGVGVLFSNADKPKPVDQAILMKDGRPTQGPADAKVTIVEFSDLQCPACKASLPLVKEVLAKHPTDVRLVFRHFPLTTVHPNSLAAAQAAEAVHAMGKFWQLHDLLFEEQENWAELSSKDFQVKLEEYLKKLEIDKTQFQKTIEKQETKDLVTADMSAGTQIGVDATPTFYVNGQKTPAPQLLSTVESLLATK